MQAEVCGQGQAGLQHGHHRIGARVASAVRVGLCASATEPFPCALRVLLTREDGEAKTWNAPTTSGSQMSSLYTGTSCPPPLAVDMTCGRARVTHCTQGETQLQRGAWRTRSPRRSLTPWCPAGASVCGRGTLAVVQCLSRGWYGAVVGISNLT